MPIDRSKFRTPQGKLRTRALFIDFSSPETSLYTVKRADDGDFPSLFRLYMEAKDITEYRFALEYFDSFDHWQALCKTAWFEPIIEAWRSELAACLKSEAFARIVAAAEADGQNSLRANEYILERKWERNTKGRPSKAQVDEAAQKQAAVDKRIKADLKRLSIPDAPVYSDQPSQTTASEPEEIIPTDPLDIED